MGRQSNQSKAIEWQKRLRRFEACNLTVARFCARERVTEPMFWYWRRKSADISPPSEPSSPAFAPWMSSVDDQCRCDFQRVRCSRSLRIVPIS